MAGAGTLVLVHTARFEVARYTAAVAVAAVVAGWASAQWPTILPGLTVHQAAAPRDTLVAVAVAVLAGAVILFPSRGLLFRLTLGGRFDSAATGAEQVRPGGGRVATMPLSGRVATACLISGFALLNVV